MINLLKFLIFIQNSILGKVKPNTEEIKHTNLFKMVFA